ncbi:MAG: hypothetical protein ACHREM_23540 [Polyangiales bacterium]
MRINGIGTTYLGFTTRDEQDRVHATLWFTFIFAPVIPLAPRHLQLLPHSGWGFSVQVLNKTPLVAREVLTTLLFGWILVPVAVFTPGVITIREVRQSIGIPDSFEDGMMVLSILWMIVWVWKLADWHEARRAVAQRT